MEKEITKNNNDNLNQESHQTFENSGTGVWGSMIFIALMLTIMTLISIYMK